MDSSIVDHDGQCPRCDATDITRTLTLQTSARVLSGVIFQCGVCGLHRATVVADRETWWNLHQQWSSPHVREASWEEFSARWPKKVERPTYGRGEPLGPTLPLLRHS